MANELRCANKLHGVIVDDLIEVVCGSRFCKESDGAVVLHKFNLSTGELIETQQYANPQKGNLNG